MLWRILAEESFRPFREMKYYIALGLVVGAVVIFAVKKMLNAKYGSGNDAEQAYEEKKRLKKMFEKGEISEEEYRAARAVISARERNL
ncbi:MAG TPA: SHOCT domain-containing protein [Tepidisphaeraceae bacterium]|jgi:uncharacterized membrane protein|nr:SHOCT domain-containing protein [Tepidisphaeraceae bacterium]